MLFTSHYHELLSFSKWHNISYVEIKISRWFEDYNKIVLPYWEELLLIEKELLGI